MKNSKTTIIIGAAVLLILVVIGFKMLGARKGVEPQSQAPASVESNSPSEDKGAEVPPSDAGSAQSTESPAPVESTPAERATRTATPSDAASYSEDDLPPDYSAVP